MAVDDPVNGSRIPARQRRDHFLMIADRRRAELRIGIHREPHIGLRLQPQIPDQAGQLGPAADAEDAQVKCLVHLEPLPRVMRGLQALEVAPHLRELIVGHGRGRERWPPVSPARA